MMREFKTNGIHSTYGCPNEYIRFEMLNKFYLFTVMEDKMCELIANSKDNADRITNDCYQWPLLLTWFNFNPSMDK